MKNNENYQKKLNVGNECDNKREKRTKSSEKVGEARRKRDECTKVEKEEA